MEMHEIIKILERIAPPELAEPWDNNGLQIDVGNNDIKKIMFTMEINEEIIDEAIEKEADLIITHHPLIFVKPAYIRMDDITGNRIIKLIKSGISVYAAHTTFDKAPLGNNYYMAKLLLLDNIEDVEGEVGVTGYLPWEMGLHEVISHIEECLELPKGYVRVVETDNLIMNKVALCTGAGGDLIYAAKKLGCDIVVTGDVKLNIAQDAKAMNLALVDAGHYGTEKIFSENIKKQFDEIMDDNIDKIQDSNDVDERKVETFIADSNTNPFNL